MPINTVKWTRNELKLIDQTKLPDALKYIHCRDIQTVWNAIRRLSVRGAPAIGVAAAYGVLLEANHFKGKTRDELMIRVDEACSYLATARPTAVNLFYALDRMNKVFAKHPGESSVAVLKKLLKDEAMAMYEEDRRVCRQMGQHGAKFIKPHNRVMTICNAGALATVDYGTALGVMYAAHEQAVPFQVYACETRPLLQGARLTTWELRKAKIPVTVICDSMAATVMKRGLIDAVFTGADRIAANGDTANKIGTYNLAILAKHHKVPFYVVAPSSTFDLTIANGDGIPIEERHHDEVTHFRHVRVAPRGVKAFNPAFDVTEAKLITAIITERGVIVKPGRASVNKVLRYDKI
ncbi:MAG: S-methyl-5-thioribose-1-phosphate isomerase [Candidatus Omnitrophica bacterium]|nr:S-methyl-5-thioribose-1-phosphate isomerase [Candidatus Omnitrophota bacterium]